MSYSGEEAFMPVLLATVCMMDLGLVDDWLCGSSIGSIQAVGNTCKYCVLDSSLQQQTPYWLCRICI